MVGISPFRLEICVLYYLGSDSNTLVLSKKALYWWAALLRWELRRVQWKREPNSKQKWRSLKDGEKVLESFKIFAQVNSRLMEFLMGWLLVLGLKECLVECPIVCVKSAVILSRHVSTHDFKPDRKREPQHQTACIIA